MSKDNLLYHLEQLDYTITLEDIFACQLGSLIEQGLQAAILCLIGKDRSYIAAKKLCTYYDIPSVCVKGGVAQFASRAKEKDSVESVRSVVSILRTVPTVAVILTNEEVLRNSWFISQLSAQTYRNSDAAIRAIEIAHYNPVRWV